MVKNVTAGSVNKVYDLVSCSIGPDGNKDNAYITMISSPGLMFGIINITGQFQLFNKFQIIYLL